MNAKFACADFTFPLLSHLHALELISMMGFRGVDIGLFESRSHLWPSRELKQPRSSARRLRRALTARGLKAADVFLQMAPDFAPFAINQPNAGARRKARDWFLRTLDFADALGCQHVTTLPGIAFPEEGRDASLARAAAELQWRVEQASAAGLVFGTEAHVGSIATTPEETLDLVRRAPGLTLTLDYTHFTRAGIADKRVEPLIAHASHFHARGACRGRLQCNFKQNTIDYARVLAAMKAAKYRGWVGVEYVWIDWEHCNESDNISETMLLRNFLRAQAATL
ncbi:sugar phosphate isomerase/epimerase [Horticoccus luteus]|uniref:Sugar phosphate isomerase/epimerase n=1 Tax=Horticoccus luteus TaxID=2862869 RepID=A0A8F9U036_9BACT|nr:TIM barrel protein [Horticoccus luteus]QYM80687.1 sugar phosphate isomerase/epimerase [Horticoccus luteus]